MNEPIPAGPHVKGATTRAQIINLAMDIASAEGLEGLTIGRLASDLNMSKSGLFAHFGSKEELQLAAVESARAVFEERVVTPLVEAPAGLPRLARMMSLWIAYIENSGFRGGCFFAAAAAEFDGRPGLVRDLIARLTSWWRDMLAEEAERARDSRELKSEVDPRLLAFELHGFAQEANLARQLLDDPEAFNHARAALAQKLHASASAKGRRLLNSLDFT